MALLQMIRHRFYDNDGSLLAGGKVYIYEAGTTTPKNSFTDYTGTVPNSNPVILNAKGEAAIWTDGYFKINVTNAADVQVTGYPVDYVGATYNNLALTGTTTAEGLSVGNQGTEGTGINISGVVYNSTFKVSDINGTNYAQTILHRHSTTLEPLIVGARSNSNTTSHTDVTAGQRVFSTYAAGWAGSNYKLFGSESFSADTTGAISDTSSPGRWSVSVTPNGSTIPVEVAYIGNDGILHANIIVPPTVPFFVKQFFPTF
jgi:hypothetical protein